MGEQHIDNKIVIAKFAAPYGIAGQIKIVSYCNPKSNIIGYKSFYIYREQKFLQLDIVEKRVFAEDKIIFKISGYDSPEAVRVFTNSNIYISRAELPPLEENEYYWNDLVGCEVRNLSGETLGVVDYLFNSGANDIIAVKNEENNQIHFVPYLKDSVIKEVSLDRACIVIDWKLV